MSRFTTILALAVLTGCVPRYSAQVRPGRMPMSYAEPIEREHVAAERERRDLATEARPSSGDTAFTLSDVVRACVLGDPEIAEALEDVHVAEGEYTSAAVLPNPGLSITQALNPFPWSRWTPERQGGPPQLDVGLSYTLDGIVFGKRAAAMKAARRAVDATAAAHANTIRRRVQEAIVGFYDVLEARALRILGREAHERAIELERITTQRVSFGSVGSLELDRVKLAVLAAHRERLRSEAEVDKANARLHAYLGWRWRERSISPSGSLEVATAQSPPLLSALLTTADTTRPDNVAAHRELERASAEITAQKRNGLPPLEVIVGYTRQFQERAIGQPDTSSFGVGLATAVPIGDRNQGAITAAEAGQRKAQAALERTRLQIRAEVEQALREYTLAYDIVTQDDHAILQSAESAREKIQESYRLGGRTLIEVLDSQEAYREAVRLSIEAHANFWRALHSLNAVLGTRVLSP